MKESDKGSVNIVIPCEKRLYQKLKHVNIFMTVIIKSLK